MKYHDSSKLSSALICVKILLLNFPFGREHALDPRIEACGLVQGAAEGLEYGFEHVVDVAAVMEADVQVHTGMVHNGLKEVLSQSGVEVLELVLLRQSHLVCQIGPAGQVHHHLGQGLVHGHGHVPVSADAFAVAEGLLEGLAESYAEVFDRMVVVDLRISLGLESEVEKAVLRNVREHVVHERHGGLDVIDARSVEVQGNFNVRFFGLAFDRRFASHPAPFFW